MSFAEYCAAIGINPRPKWGLFGKVYGAVAMNYTNFKILGFGIAIAALYYHLPILFAGYHLAAALGILMGHHYH